MPTPKNHRQSSLLKFLLAALISPLLLIPGTPSAVASVQPSEVDPSYGDHGSAALPAAFSSVAALRSVVLRLDNNGRAVIAGTAEFQGSGELHTFLARYNANGTLDTSFCGVGWEIVPSSSNSLTQEMTNALVIDGNNNIFLGSTLTIGDAMNTNNNLEQINIRKIKPDCSIDTQFGANGAFSEPIYADQANPVQRHNIITPMSMAIDHAGSVITTFSSQPSWFDNSSFSMNILKLNSSGAPFISSNQSSVFYQGLWQMGGANLALADVQIDEQNNMYFSGFADSPYAQNFEQMGSVFKLSSDGIIDNQFANNMEELNRTISPLKNGQFSFIISSVLDGAGHILVDGTYLSSGGVITTYVGRLNISDGSVDSSFGVNGLVTFGHTSPYQVILEPNGKIVSVGYYDATPVQGPMSTPAIIRFTETGTIDTSFGENGIQLMGPLADAAFLSDGSYINASLDRRSGLVALSLMNATGPALTRFYLEDNGISAPTPSSQIVFEYPKQKSLISSISPTKAIAGEVASISITGSFFEPIVNIMVNGKLIPANSWKQSPTEVSFTLEKPKAGDLQIQLFNGSAPVLTAPTINVVDKTPNPATIFVKPHRTLILCVKDSRHFKHIFDFNPTCPVGYTRSN